MQDIKKRILAIIIDYLIIGVYALLLFLAVQLITAIMHISLKIPSPVTGQLIGFFTLTMPVFLYFFLFEKGVNKATIGKKLNKIKVEAPGNNPIKKVFYRNLLKLLPWELAHMGVHWLLYYSEKTEQPPVIVWIVLILPQLIVIYYVFTIFKTKGGSSWYDAVAGTRVVPVNMSPLRID